MRRALVVAWLLLAAAVWNGFFDLYVSRGAREYLQKSAEHAAGLVPAEPDPPLDRIMAVATRDGLVAATLWSLAVLGLGLISLRAGRRDREPPRPGE